MAEQATGAAFAATWRNQEGDVVGTAFGGTMCWMPRKPWTLRIVREGYAHIIRCGECPGCLEFERRREAGRLAAKYGRGSARIADRATRRGGRSAKGAAESIRSLFLVRIYAPLEEHAALSHKLHRRPRLELEPGYWRLGADSFAVLSRTRSLPPLSLRGAPLRIRVEPILLRRGKRAWRGLTGGILCARAVYGEQTNRWYCRGLPKAEKQRWEVDRHAGAKGYSRASSPRAWKSSNTVLVPPEVWRLGRADRRSLRRDLHTAVNPEGVARVMGLVRDALSKRDSSSLIGPAVRPVLTSDEVKEWYASMAKRIRAASESERTENPTPLSSEREGYVSSGHSSGAPPPKLTAVEAAQRIIEIRRESMRERGERYDEGGSLFQRRDRELLRQPLEPFLDRLRKRGVDDETIEKLRRAWTKKRG